MITKQKRWGKKVKYVRNWKEINKTHVLRATFYLDFEWVKSWNSELVEMNLKKRGHNINSRIH